MKPNIVDRMRCYLRIPWILTLDVWRIITAPIVYPFYYVFFRKWLSKNWEEINKAVETKSFRLVRRAIIMRFGLFGYFIWLYGDKEDPMGNANLLEWAGDGTKFWPRYKWAALRNPMFNLCLIGKAYNTAYIERSYVEYDRRCPDSWATSNGLGAQRFGSVKVWFKDIDGKWYFVWEYADEKKYQYLGWVGKLDRDSNHARWEFAFRSTKSTYHTKSK